MTYNVFSGTLNPTHFTSTTDDDKYRLLTAVLFIGEVSTVVESITDKLFWNTEAAVIALEHVRSACACSCIYEQHKTLQPVKLAAFRHKVKAINVYVCSTILRNCSKCTREWDFCEKHCNTATYQIKRIMLI